MTTHTKEHVTSLAERAKAVGLPEDASERDITIMESVGKPGGPSTLAARAIIAGVDYNASESEISAAELRKKELVHKK